MHSRFLVAQSTRTARAEMLWLSAFGECKKGFVLVVTGHRNTAAVKFVANCVRRLILGNVQTDDPDRSRALGHC